METTTVYRRVQRKRRWIPTSDIHLEEAEKLVFYFWVDMILYTLYGKRIVEGIFNYHAQYRN